ncbi:hypothetical protein RRG08_024443 [Elysia crispata]|uniref:Uncharacterized protein n=1 Tax=Elysia crispata TaxID=231223 RepID=A0AAE1D273_9GAST|nr:hypothetical protein RRG08_024443 [Elysia crispata]
MASDSCLRRVDQTWARTVHCMPACQLSRGHKTSEAGTADMSRMEIAHCGGTRVAVHLVRGERSHRGQVWCGNGILYDVDVGLNVAGQCWRLELASGCVIWLTRQARRAVQSLGVRPRDSEIAAADGKDGFSSLPRHGRAGRGGKRRFDICAM